MGGAQVLDGHVEERFQFVIAFIGELEAVEDLLADLFAQAFLDDVAHMFEIDGVVDDRDRTAGIIFVQSLAAKLREVDLHLLL